MTRSHNGRFLSRLALGRLGLAEFGEDVLIHPDVVLVGCERMHLGSHVRIDPGCVITATTRLRIGSRVHIASHVSIVAAAPVEIGDFANISHGARVLATSDDFSAGGIAGPMIPMELRTVVAAPISLGRHSILGANSVLLPGARLGEGTAVGALSLLKRPVEDWTVWAGIPARRVGQRDKEEVLRREQSLMASSKPAGD